MANFCKKCGTQLGGGAFCPNCGAKTEARIEQQASNRPPAGIYGQGPQQNAGSGQPSHGQGSQSDFDLSGVIDKVKTMAHEAEKKTNIHILRLVLMGLTVIGFLSMLMEWVKIMGISNNAFTVMEEAAWLVLILFLIPGGLALAGDKTQPLSQPAIGAAISGFLVASIAIANIVTAQSEINQYSDWLSSSMISLGFGVYLASFVGIAITGASIYSFIMTKKSAS